MDWDPFADPADEVDESYVAVSSTRRSAELPAPTKLKSVSLDKFLGVLDLARECGVPAKVSHILTPVVDEVLAAGPLKHTLLCILARRLVVLLQEERCAEGDHLARELMRCIKEACARDSNMIVLSPESLFSGRVHLLLGWGGSSASDMLDCGSRYRALDAGCVVVALTMECQTQVASVLEVLSGVWRDCPDVLPCLWVHLFSNLGFNSWVQILKSWKADELGDTSHPRLGLPSIHAVLRGVVLDSAPDDQLPRMKSIRALMRSDAALLSMLVAVDVDGRELSDVERDRASLDAKTEVLKREGLLWEDVGKMTDEAVAAKACADTCSMHEAQPSVPELFIYSVADQVIPVAGVERYITECESRANRDRLDPPRRLTFSGTAHCFHKRDKADEYWRAVDAFVKETSCR